MKKILLSAAVLAISAGSALAADLPSKKSAPVYVPPPPPAVWTGFYAGLNAGYTFSDNTNIAYPVFTNGVAPGFGAGVGFASSLNNDGFIGGGQIGYNWQFNNVFVAGVEADIQGVATGSKTGYAATGVVAGVFGANVAGTGFGQVQRSLDYLGTVRGRLGYLVTPTLLLYGTGGLAYGQTNLSTAAVGPGVFAAASFSDTRVGWTAGGGLEWMFMPRWSAKIEYLYYDLGSIATPAAVASGSGVGGGLITGYSASSRFSGHIVRAGVNYHFNWGAPAPVVAKY
jgi:outer membrane immunogenic protein